MQYGFKVKSATIMLGLGLLCVNAYAEENQNIELAAYDPGQQPSMQVAVPNKSSDFLAANKNKPGVKTTANGLQYKILTQGKGEKPIDGNSVTVDYEGKLVDGSVFDSSYKRGEPATFPVNGVIPGWTEALKLMPVGSTWELFIPANLAYGEQGAPPSIGPNETLIFKVHLISVAK